LGAGEAWRLRWGCWFGRVPVCALYFMGAVLWGRFWGRFSVFSNANKVHAFSPFVNTPHGLPNVYGGFRHKKNPPHKGDGFVVK